MLWHVFKTLFFVPKIYLKQLDWIFFSGSNSQKPQNFSWFASKKIAFKVIGNKTIVAKGVHCTNRSSRIYTNRSFFFLIFSCFSSHLFLGNLDHRWLFWGIRKATMCPSLGVCTLKREEKEVIRFPDNKYCVFFFMKHYSTLLKMLTVNVLVLHMHWQIFKSFKFWTNFAYMPQLYNAQPCSTYCRQSKSTSNWFRCSSKAAPLHKMVHFCAKCFFLLYHRDE